jgi:hypothetical protein
VERCQCWQRRGRSRRGLVYRDPSLAKEVVTFAPARATSSAPLQELSDSVLAIESVEHARTASRDVARARECPPVRKCTRLVPARIRNLAVADNATSPLVCPRTVARADNTAGDRASPPALLANTRRRSSSRAAGCPSSMSCARPVAILATWVPCRMCRSMLGVGLEHATRRSVRLCRAARCCVGRERA